MPEDAALNVRYWPIAVTRHSTPSCMAALLGSSDPMGRNPIRHLDFLLYSGFGWNEENQICITDVDTRL